MKPQEEEEEGTAAQRPRRTLHPRHTAGTAHTAQGTNEARGGVIFDMSGFHVQTKRHRHTRTRTEAHCHNRSSISISILHISQMHAIVDGPTVCSHPSHMQATHARSATGPPSRRACSCAMGAMVDSICSACLTPWRGCHGGTGTARHARPRTRRRKRQQNRGGQNQRKMQK